MKYSNRLGNKTVKTTRARRLSKAISLEFCLIHCRIYEREYQNRVTFSTKRNSVQNNRQQTRYNKLSKQG